MSGHPSDEVLVQWLESDKPARVGRHVEGCAACLDRVEALSDLDGGLMSELASASSPPTDLHVKTTGVVQGRLAAEEAVAAVFELFTLPWNTAVVLLDPGGTRAEVVDAAVSSSHDSDEDEERADG